MRVNGIDSDSDFVFGRGKASYKTKSPAIAQNVLTRLRSFTNDWFLDTESGIPWLELIGTKGNLDAIKQAISGTVLQTLGVITISRLDVIEDRKNRAIKIYLTYNDVFNNNIVQSLEILP